MSWTRAPLAALAVCVLVLAGPAGCGSGEAHEGKNGASPSPVGKLLERTDERGRHYREVAEKGAPEIEIEVAPDADSWDVRLTVRNFRFSPAGTGPRAVTGRGLAYLYVDGDIVARLRTPGHRLAAGLVPRGTHHVTARLYADDGTVWAVHGKPVESTADITESATRKPPPGGVTMSSGGASGEGGAGGASGAGGAAAGTAGTATGAQGGGTGTASTATRAQGGGTGTASTAADAQGGGTGMTSITTAVTSADAHTKTAPAGNLTGMHIRFRTPGRSSPDRAGTAS